MQRRKLRDPFEISNGSKNRVQEETNGAGAAPNLKKADTIAENALAVMNHQGLHVKIMA